ncbi:MAG: hypothetical protein PHS26_07090 [Actinomycetota bacterium]|nr:hypothetical protein [Actinomycetota bacterium]
MSEWKACKECGVPRVLTKEYLWLDNGDIVQARDQRDRIVFTECENLDPLFRGIEEIIATPISHVVIDCVRRTYRTYCGLFLPKNVDELVKKKRLDLKSLDDGLAALAAPMGVGRYGFVDMRCEWDDGDFYTVSVSEPNSIPMCVAAHCGAIEAIQGRDHGVRYAEKTPGVFEITAFPSPHPEGLKGRLTFERYSHDQGDITLDRCATCGGPSSLSRYQWHFDRGIITSRSTGRRMAVMGPSQIDPIFRELEMELGDEIPRVVVEAQRRFTKTGFYAMSDYANVDEFRAGLAMRGLGNIKELVIKRTGLRMRMENAVLHLMLVGMMQGIFDAALDLDSTVDWEYTKDGVLELEVSPEMVVV